MGIDQKQNSFPNPPEPRKNLISQPGIVSPAKETPPQNTQVNQAQKEIVPLNKTKINAVKTNQFQKKTTQVNQFQVSASQASVPQGIKVSLQTTAQTEIQTKKSEPGKEKIKQFSFLSRLMIGQEKNYFIENLSLLLSSGMNILSALEAIQGELRSKQMLAILTQLKREVEEGSPIWRALYHTGLFSKNTISLVQIGEKSGRLAENLEIISTQDQKERLFRSKIFSAMLYPIIVISMTFIIGIGIAWFLLPKLAGVFVQMRLDLPLPTRIMIFLGNFFADYGIIVVPISIVLLIFFILLIFVFPKTQFIGQALLLHFPGIKRLMQEVEISRFGFILGTLLETGMSVVDALNSLNETTTLQIYKSFYSHLRNRVEQGDSFKKSFLSYKGTNRLVPVPIQQMIISSEQSGRLSKTLLKIAGMYESKIEVTTKNLSVILEPILLIVVWLAVALVAFAVILPIYSLIGGIK